MHFLKILNNLQKNSLSKPIVTRGWLVWPNNCSVGARLYVLLDSWYYQINAVLGERL